MMERKGGSSLKFGMYRLCQAPLLKSDTLLIQTIYVPVIFQPK